MDLGNAPHMPPTTPHPPIRFQGVIKVLYKAIEGLACRQTCGVEVCVAFQVPDVAPARAGHEVTQQQVDGVLLLCVRVGVGIQAAQGRHEVTALGGRLPVATLALEEGRVRL